MGKHQSSRCPIPNRDEFHTEEAAELDPGLETTGILYSYLVHDALLLAFLSPLVMCGCLLAVASRASDLDALGMDCKRRYALVEVVTGVFQQTYRAPGV